MAANEPNDNYKQDVFEMRGFLEIEDEEVKFFTKRFFELKRDKDILEYYKEDPRLEKSAQKDGSINILNVTKIAASTQRPKKENCFEICLTDKNYFLAAPSIENMRDWVNALHHAAVNPRYRTKSSDEVKKQPSLDDGISYQTSIIGGVVMKVPKQQKDSDDQTGSSSGKTGGLKPLKEGWCFKQGGVMKNWKRRYFTLSVIKLCYFESPEEKAPLRSILTQDLKAVREVPGFSGKDNVLEIETPYRKFYMQPDSKQELRKWKQAIEELRFSSGSSTFK
eukprot:gene5396-6070_t